MAYIDRKLIETAVDKYKHEKKSSCFVKAADLKPKQLKNAIKHIAPKEKEENIVAMMDITVLSSGKKGMVITEDKVYFNDIFAIEGNHIRKYSDIKNLCRVEKKDEIRSFVCLYTPAPEEGHLYLDRINCSIFRDDIYNFFNTLVKLLPKEEKPEEDSPTLTLDEIGEMLDRGENVIHAIAQEAQNKLNRERELKEKAAQQPKPEPKPAPKPATPITSHDERESVSVLLYGRDPKATKMFFDGLREQTFGTPVKPSERGVKEAFETKVAVGFKMCPCVFKYRATALGYTNPEDDLLICVENDYEFASGMRFGNSVIDVPGEAKAVLVCLWHDANSYPVRDLSECVDSFYRMNPNEQVEFYAKISLDENGICADAENADDFYFLQSIIEDMLL